MERRLAAILSVDVAGYSRLMGADETGTLAAINRHRKELIEPKVRQYNGRIVKLMGDGALMEFASAVDAVAFAAEMQCAMAGRNRDIPKKQQILYRIGINVGDIIIEGDDIFGDGVNIAARLEGLAEPGGICIARNVLNQVRGKLDLTFKLLGKRKVKNIAQPVTVHRVVLDEKAEQFVTRIGGENSDRWNWKSISAVAVAAFIVTAGGLVWWQPWTSDLQNPEDIASSPNQKSLPLPDKPSIAVLPFTNISNNPEQEYFVDGMTEDVITDLSKISGLFVIARNSVFTYKGKTVRVRQIAKELGVRYVLEGSVRRIGKQVRINTQLIDSNTEGHVWAARYDGTIDNVFALQDRITRRITEELALKLTPSDVETLTDHGTKVVEAHDAFLKGWKFYQQSTSDELVAAARMFRKAIDLDPLYGRAHAALALTYWQASQRFWEIHFGMSWKQIRILMMRHLEKALATPTAIANRLASSVYLDQRRYNEAIAAARRAIELDGNSAEAHRALAYALLMSGQVGEARKMTEIAWRLDPRAPGQHFLLLGLTAFAEARPNKTVELMERARNHIKHANYFLPPLVAAYMHLGRTDEGRSLAEIYYDWFPSYSTDLRNIMYFWPFKDLAVASRLADGLLLAGVQGEPGGYYRLSDEHRLSYGEIHDLFSQYGRRWKIYDVREFGGSYSVSMDLTDTYREDGQVVRIYKEVQFDTTKYEWTGRYRIDNDLLCTDFPVAPTGGVGCRPVFRNPEAGDSERKFVIVGVFGFHDFYPAN